MNDIMMIETMNIQETTQLLRDLGMKISPKTLQLGIEQGTFPFGTVVRTDKSPIYIVYRVMLEEWIAQRIRGGKYPASGAGSPAMRVM